MKTMLTRVFTTSITCTLLLLTPNLQAEEIIKETQTHNVFKGALLSIWGRFKSFNPHAKQNARSATVYTAGVRGAESTGTLIQPYWKDDLTQDKAFQDELKLFGEAITHLDNGSLTEATTTLEEFLSSYSSSSLKPNALFAEGISYAGLGNNQRSIQSLDLFVKEFPLHPLSDDAKLLMQQLK